MRERVGKSRNTLFFQWFGAPEGWKVGSLKRRVRIHLARGEMKSCTPLWREAHLEVKMYKTPQLRTTFGSWDVEKVHAVVARSTFGSQNVQNTPSRTTFGSWDVEKVHAVVARSTFPSQNVQNTSAPDHFWKLRCRKSARRCGAKHFQVKMYKTPHVRATFGGSDVEKVHAVVARSTFPSQNVQNTRGSDMFGPLLEVQMSLRFASGDYTTLYTRLHYRTLHYTTLHNTTTTTTELHNYTPLHSTTLNYNTLRHITLHSTTLHYTTLHTPLHYTTLHYTIHSAHYSTLHYTTLHNTTTTITELHNYTPLHSTTHRYTKLHYTTLHYTRKIDR